jgi:hypothetical protein
MFNPLKTVGDKSGNISFAIEDEILEYEENNQISPNSNNASLANDVAPSPLSNDENMYSKQLNFKSSRDEEFFMTEIEKIKTSKSALSPSNSQKKTKAKELKLIVPDIRPVHDESDLSLSPISISPKIEEKIEKKNSDAVRVKTKRKKDQKLQNQDEHIKTLFRPDSATSFQSYETKACKMKRDHTINVTIPMLEKQAEEKNFILPPSKKISIVENIDVFNRLSKATRRSKQEDGAQSKRKITLLTSNSKDQFNFFNSASQAEMNLDRINQLAKPIPMDKFLLPRIQAPRQCIDCPQLAITSISQLQYHNKSTLPIPLNVNIIRLNVSISSSYNTLFRLPYKEVYYNRNHNIHVRNFRTKSDYSLEQKILKDNSCNYYKILPSTAITNESNIQTQNFFIKYGFNFICVILDYRMQIIGTYDASLQQFCPGISLRPSFFHRETKRIKHFTLSAEGKDYNVDHANLLEIKVNELPPEAFAVVPVMVDDLLFNHFKDPSGKKSTTKQTKRRGSVGYEYLAHEYGKSHIASTVHDHMQLNFEVFLGASTETNKNQHFMHENNTVRKLSHQPVQNKFLEELRLKFNTAREADIDTLKDELVTCQLDGISIRELMKYRESRVRTRFRKRDGWVNAFSKAVADDDMSVMSGCSHDDDVSVANSAFGKKLNRSRYLVSIIA